MLDDPGTDDGEHTKEVYAWFGVAFYHAQCLEVALKNVLLLHLSVTGAIVTRKQFDSHFADLAKKTIGPLKDAFDKISGYGSSPDNDSNILRKAWKLRNFLAHDFFHDRAAEFFSRGGREKMIDELVGIANDMQKADCLVTSLAEALRLSLGLTDEMIAAKVVELKAKAYRVGRGPRHHRPDPRYPTTDPQ